MQACRIEDFENWRQAICDVDFKTPSEHRYERFPQKSARDLVFDVVDHAPMFHAFFVYDRKDRDVKSQAYYCMDGGELAMQIVSDEETKFKSLCSTWYSETGMLSMIQKKAMHPAYQRIIGMGKDALPFIFKELKRGKGDWLWALQSITDEDPAGGITNFKQAVSAWLEWGKAKGWI